MNTPWTHWHNRQTIKDLNQLGIYFIAFSDKDLEGKPFSMIKEIIYIGMSISMKGVKGRLKQFESAMRGANGRHGGAERVRFKHKDPEAFFKNAYLSVMLFPVSESRKTPKDWKQKGECVKHEYESFGNYLEKYGELPEFNDMKRSKKK